MKKSNLPKQMLRAMMHFARMIPIDRQWVFIGDKVNILFNYAPIGFGGEKLHFLVVRKQHRQSFTDVTKEEYCETLDLTKKLVEHFISTREKVTNVYLMNNTGVKPVKQFPIGDFWGRLTVFKNILLGARLR